MKKSEPYTVMGNFSKHRVVNNDPKFKLALIAAKARDNPRECFNNLMHHLNQELVTECLSQIPKSSAPGIDGLTVEQARKHANWLLPPVLRQIHNGQYKAPAVKRVLIPKGDGTKRPIGIPQVLDRALQAGMAQILSQIYEQDFLTYSFGFRSGLGCHNALATVNELIGNKNLKYALEVDIRDFFGSLSHKWLRKFLELRIKDKRVLKLIEAWLKAGVLENGKWEAKDQGTPQGGSISPLLANIYLHYVLDLWFQRKVKNNLRGQAHLVRYADDFVILFEKQEDIEDVKVYLETRLAQFGLAISEAKTHTANLIPRVNKSGRERRHIKLLGFNIFLAKNRFGTGYKTVYHTSSKSFSQAKAGMKQRLFKMMHWDLDLQVKGINSILRGHFHYFGLAGNITRLNNFRRETIRYWRHCLSRRSQRGKMSWESFNKLLSDNILIKPQLKIPYGNLAQYVRL